MHSAALEVEHSLLVSHPRNPRDAVCREVIYDSKWYRTNGSADLYLLVGCLSDL